LGETRELKDEDALDEALEGIIVNSTLRSTLSEEFSLRGIGKEFS
jgi:hypothetical protein